MHPAVTRAAQRANGGSIPSLRTAAIFARYAGSPNGGAPASKSGSDWFDPSPACLIRSFMTTWPSGKGAELQPPLTQVRFLPSSLFVSKMVAVAQLVRAPGCEPGSCGFKPHRSPCRKAGIGARVSGFGSVRVHPNPEPRNPNPVFQERLRENDGFAVAKDRLRRILGEVDAALLRRSVHAAAVETRG
jgi:hypothetical protein